MSITIESELIGMQKVSEAVAITLKKNERICQTRNDNKRIR